MARTKNPSTSKQPSRRADGKTQTSISMREDLLELARQEAASQGRSLSNWIEQMLREIFGAAAEAKPKPAATKAPAPAKPAAKAAKAAKAVKTAPPAKKAAPPSKKAAAPAKKASKKK